MKKTAQKQPRFRPLQMESLESRRVLAVFTVTNTNDSGPGSLRDAVVQTNDSYDNNNTIQFDGSLNGATINLLRELRLEKDVQITTLGLPDGVTIDLSAGDLTPGVPDGRGIRAFNIVDFGFSNSGVSLTGLTITGGDVFLDGGAILVDSGRSVALSRTTFVNNAAMGAGGALYQIDDFGSFVDIQNSTFSGNIASQCGAMSLIAYESGARIQQSTISGNRATSGDGGGICALHELGLIEILDSTIEGNYAAGNGGGISLASYREDDMEIRDSVITSNSAGGQGGGLFIRGSSLIDSTTIAENHSAGSAGGIYSLLRFGPTVLRQVTVSGNTASGDVGGIHAVGGRRDYDSELQLDSSTVTGNMANVDGTAGPDSTSGVLLEDTRDIGVTFHITKSIVAENVGGNDLATLSVSPAQLTVETTLVGEPTDDVFPNGPGDNLVGLDPLLLPLEDNGGNVPTHGLLGGSPAIDAGPIQMAGVSQVDARGPGFARFFDGDQNGVANMDLGAFEFSGRAGPLDFNADGFLNCIDVDALIGGIAAGSTSAEFDLTNDGNVDLADRDEWLATAGEANIGIGASYQLGDANLDGVVDISDFNVWNEHKFSFLAEWCSGDFNADGSVDASDFNIWNEQKFTSATSFARPDSQTTDAHVEERIIPSPLRMEQSSLVPLAVDTRDVVFIEFANEDLYDRDETDGESADEVFPSPFDLLAVVSGF